MKYGQKLEYFRNGNNIRGQIEVFVQIVRNLKIKIKE